MKSWLQERLSLRSRLLLKRLLVASVGACVRAAALVVTVKERLLQAAVKHGLDLHRAWDVPPKLPPASRARAPQPFGARDFLFVMDALSGGGRVGARVDGEPPRTSIIIPVFNQAEYTFQCLRSLLREIDFGRDEVIVVDNASTDETRRVLAHFGQLVRVVSNEENRGFVEACNRGAAAARGRYLVFLNNDTEVLPGWLRHLVETVERDETIGAVGSMFLYPDGRVQEAGAGVWQSGEAFHYGWGASPDDRRYNFARDVDYCSGASLLIRKSLFDRLGGFDRRYAPAYYEDADLCFGVRSLGQRVVYQPASKLVHHEGGTAGTDTSTGFKHYQIVNRGKFVEKWRDTLVREHLPKSAANLGRAADRRRGPALIVFDERVPTPDRDAGSARMFVILKSLSAWARVTFVPLYRPHGRVYEELLWKEGIETASYVDYPGLLRERQFYAAVFSRPDVAGALLESVRRRAGGEGRTKIVFDMVDAYFIRLGREHALSGDARLKAEAERYQELETRLARASDLVWCNSSEDKSVMEKLAPGVRIEVIPTIHELHGRGPSFEERAGLLFVGNLAHRPNADGVHFLMREVFPLVRAELPGVELTVVGDNVSPEIAAYASGGVRVTGYVPEVEPFFRRARVFVAPIRFGAGVKGKIGEALAHGLPLVTTKMGAEGMGLLDGEEALIADAPRDFAEAVVRLYRDEDLWRRVADEGYAHVEKNFTPKVVAQVINSSLQEIGGLSLGRGIEKEARGLPGGAVEEGGDGAAAEAGR